MGSRLLKLDEVAVSVNLSHDDAQELSLTIDRYGKEGDTREKWVQAIVEMAIRDFKDLRLSES
jgi:hypothetical protein